ncbi:vacuolar protein sorting 36 [Dermatophagoides pteronyssinus]|uniref:vacuolar protein sorting 36 n=1 Tax=Dermatophagoides pteronyssinus TaxID=6956 RepID=UPI003F677A06
MNSFEIKMDKKKYRQGIGGIERKIQDQHEETSRNIDGAFQDLKNLMSFLEEMVKLSNSIKDKLKEKGNEISSDETILFKSYLLSLGVDDDIEDPVKRSKYRSDNKYYQDLGRQVAKIIKPLAKSKGGQISLPEVYCAYNRSRGFSLISPEDLYNGCSTMEKQNLGMKIVKYPSGLITLQCDDFDQNYINNQIVDMFDQHENLTPQEFAIKVDISVALARQRLIESEKFGIVCRDESIQGLRFYPNKFAD